MMLGRELAETDERARVAAATRRRATSCCELDGLRQGAAMSRRSISSCAGRGRRVSPACSARAAPRWRGCCSAPSAPTAAQVERRRRAGAAAVAARRACATASAICPEERKTEGIVAELIGAREHRARAAGQRAACIGRCRAREQDEIAEPLRQGARHPPAGSGAADRRSCPAATSRRCCWRAGSRPSRALLILDEPTRGIDVGAKPRSSALIRELCDDGLALLVISSELDEIVAYSDRVVVLRDRAPCRRARGRRDRASAHHRGDRRRWRGVAHEGRHDSARCRAAAWPRSSRSIVILVGRSRRVAAVLRTCGCRTASCTAA